MVAVDGSLFPVLDLDDHGRVIYQALVAPREALIGYFVGIGAAADQYCAECCAGYRAEYRNNVSPEFHISS